MNEKIMNNNQSTGLCKPCVEQEGHGWFNFASIQKIVNISSIFCTFVGVSLLSAIFFGLSDILDYRNIRLVYECAHYAVVAAVILCVLAFLLSFLKEGSKSNATKMNTRDLVFVPNNQIANLNTDTSFLADKSKTTENYNKVEQCTVTKGIVPTNTSLNLHETTKKVEIKPKISLSSSKSENLNADSSKQEAITNALPPNTQQASNSGKEEKTKILPLNISEKALLDSSASKQSKNVSISSPNVPSNSLHQSNAITPKNEAISTSDKPQSQTLNVKSSCKDQQLVLYEKNSKPSFCGQDFQKTPSYQVSNFYESIPTSMPAYSPVTEITATKRTTVTPWGIAQEEYKVSQRTFYHVSRSPMGRISPTYGMRPTFNWEMNNGGVQDCVVSQPTFHQYPSYHGTPSSLGEQRSKFGSQNGQFSPILHQPTKVKDVLSRFESMNIFH